MQIKKGEPPKSIERTLAIEMTREEVLSILTSHLKQNLKGYPFRMDDISVHGDPDGKLQKMELSGVEVIPISWKSEQPLGVDEQNPK